MDNSAADHRDNFNATEFFGDALIAHAAADQIIKAQRANVVQSEILSRMTDDELEAWLMERDRLAASKAARNEARVNRFFLALLAAVILLVIFA